LTIDRKSLEELRSKEHIFYLMSERRVGAQWSPRDIWFFDVWFVNNSGEILTEVANSSGGYETVDDEVITMTTLHPKVYKDVKPKEAVLISRYDEMYDSDSVIEFAADVTALSFGKQRFSGECTKGVVPDATLLWKPLPQEIHDPDNPGELLSPEKAASDYKKKTGRCLVLNRFTTLNLGDLREEYAVERLAPSGVQLEKESHRSGRVTEYRFKDEVGNLLFRTCDLKRAGAFVNAMKNGAKKKV